MSDEEMLAPYITTVFGKPYCFLCKHCTRNKSLLDNPICTKKNKRVDSFKLSKKCFEQR